jgi:hypothetical protein
MAYFVVRLLKWGRVRLSLAVEISPLHQERRRCRDVRELS